MRYHVRIQLILLLLCIAVGSSPARAGAGEGAKSLSPQQAQRIIAIRSLNAVAALHDRKLVRLAGYVHPRRGLRFSPYVSAAREDLRFSRRQIRNLGRTPRRYTWGSYDGSGEPARLTWRQYYQRFVYARDYARAPQVLYNVITHRGNITNNLKQTYSNAILVEYHYPATGDELNWKSLWLIWQKQGATWYLSGVANDEWST